MKPNEVMIGDWVKFTDPDTNETELHRISQEDFSGNDKFWNCFSRIEIAPEILEAKGFYKVSKDESENIVKPDVWIYEKEDNVIVIGLKGGDFSSFEIYNDRRYAAFTDRLYVSELQHAMRMMGMHELADNFVIEKGGKQ